MLRLRSALVAIAGIVATWQSMEGYSLAQFPGTSVAGLGDKNVTTIIFAPAKK